MKKTFTLLAALLVIAFSHSVAAAPGVVIRGTPSCGKWVKDRSTKGWEAITDEAWLIGYLSGQAAARHLDFLRDVNSDSMFLWVDNYCNAKPLDDVDDSGNGLMQELIKRKGL